MFELVAMHVMIFTTILTSVVGAVCIFRGRSVSSLGINARNIMYIGACCAMCFGFLGAAFCLGSLAVTQWHLMATVILCIVGLFATAHISVDLSHRLSC